MMWHFYGYYQEYGTVSVWAWFYSSKIKPRKILLRMENWTNMTYIWIQIAFLGKQEDGRIGWIYQSTIVFLFLWVGKIMPCFIIKIIHTLMYKCLSYIYLFMFANFPQPKAFLTQNILHGYGNTTCV